MNNIDIIKYVMNTLKYCESILDKSINFDLGDTDETDIRFLLYINLIDDILTKLRKHEISDEKIELCVKLLNSNNILKEICNEVKQSTFNDYDFVYIVLVSVAELCNDLRYNLQKRSKECFCF